MKLVFFYYFDVNNFEFHQKKYYFSSPDIFLTSTSSCIATGSPRRLFHANFPTVSTSAAAPQTREIICLHTMTSGCLFAHSRAAIIADKQWNNCGGKKSWIESADDAADKSIVFDVFNGGYFLEFCAVLLISDECFLLGFDWSEKLRSRHEVLWTNAISNRTRQRLKRNNSANGSADTKTFPSFVLACNLFPVLYYNFFVSTRFCSPFFDVFFAF